MVKISSQEYVFCINKSVVLFYNNFIYRAKYIFNSYYEDLKKAEKNHIFPILLCFFPASVFSHHSILYTNGRTASYTRR